MQSAILLLLLLSGCFKAYYDRDFDKIPADVDCDDNEDSIGGPDQDQDGQRCKGLGGDDCNDLDPTTYLNAAELCDGVDNNCNGKLLSAEGQDTASSTTGEQRVQVYADYDDDGFGGIDSDEDNVEDTISIEVYACQVPAGFVLISGDCNDSDAAVNPDAEELCDTIDNDCDAQTDSGLLVEYPDLDHDNHGEMAQAPSLCPGFGVTTHDDCDDSRSDTHPGADEICDLQDNDCDDQVDEAVTLTVYPDEDEDGFGSDEEEGEQACILDAGFAPVRGDCDDSDASLSPESEELCDTIDNDCNDKVDEGVSTTYYQDSDGDGHGIPAVTATGCALPEGFSSAADDCRDDSASVYPGQTESCNGIDDNCDGETDEALVALRYADKDHDGYGVSTPTSVCKDTAGYVDNGSDCDDDRADVSPNHSEACNDRDDNCDGSIDEGVQHVYYADADHDTFGNPNSLINACSAPTGYVTNALDCNDGDAYVHPDATALPGADGDTNCSGIDGDSQTTFAGGFTGDGGGLADGQLGVMGGLVVSSGNRIYINSRFDHRIRRIDWVDDWATAELSTVAGTGVEGAPERVTKTEGIFASGGALASNLTLALSNPSRVSGLAQFEQTVGGNPTKRLVYFTDLSGVWRVDELAPAADTAMKRMLASETSAMYGPLASLVKNSAPVLYVLQYDMITSSANNQSIQRLTWDTNDALSTTTVLDDLSGILPIAASTRSLDSEYLWLGKSPDSLHNTAYFQRVKLTSALNVVETIDIQWSNLTTFGVETFCVKEESSTFIYLIERYSDSDQKLVKLQLPDDSEIVNSSLTPEVVLSIALPSYTSPRAIALGPSGSDYEVLFGGSDRTFYGLSSEELEVKPLPGLSEAALRAPGRLAKDAILEKPFGVDVLSGQLYVAESLDSSISQFGLADAELKSYLHPLGSLWDVSAIQWKDDAHDGTVSLFVADYNHYKVYDAKNSSLSLSLYPNLPTSVFAWTNDQGTPSLLYTTQQGCIYQAYYQDSAFTVVPYAGVCGGSAKSALEGPVSTVAVSEPWDITASLIPSGKGYRLDRVFYSSRGFLYQIADNYVTKLHDFSTDSHGPWIEYAQLLDSSGLQEVLFVASEAGYVQRLDLLSNTIKTIAGVGPESAEYPALGDVDAPAGGGRMGALRNLAFDPDTGILYVADEGANKIRAIQAQ